MCVYIYDKGRGGRLSKRVMVRAVNLCWRRLLDGPAELMFTTGKMMGFLEAISTAYVGGGPWEC